jgi:hypothetical protein
LLLGLGASQATSGSGSSSASASTASTASTVVTNNRSIQQPTAACLFKAGRDGDVIIPEAALKKAETLFTSVNEQSAVVDLTEMDVVIDSIEIQQIHADIALAVHHYERAVGYLGGSRSLADCPKATLAVQSSRVTKGKKKVPVSALSGWGDKATQTSTAEKGLQELEILECRFTCVLVFLYLYEGRYIYIYKSVDTNFIYIYVYIYICMYMFVFVSKVKLWKQKSTLH